MMREMIFMLNGYPGSLFNANEDGSFELCQAMANMAICDSEKEMLKPLLEVGSIVSYLNKFTDERKTDSVYCNAIKSSVEKCLKEYRNTLVQLEERILVGPNGIIGMMAIHASLLPYLLLLNCLKAFVDSVKLQKHNCLLIDIVKHHEIHCGIPKGIAAFKTIYDDVIQVLFKQLVSWMIFGKLLDPYNEFFIYQNESDHYVIDGEKIPNCISITLAQQVLFVGESVVSLSEAQDLSEEDWDFMEKIQEIPFQNIQKLIHLCQDRMGKRLWNLVTQDNRLTRCLTFIRNIFLMKKGDVFKHYLRDTEITLDSTCTTAQLPISQTIVHERLISSLKKYLSEEESEISRLSVRLNPDGKGQGWDRLFLDYKSEWPLDILIFIPETLETYNKLFRFLLKMRRILFKLNGLWKDIPKSDRDILELRWNLQHVITHLSQYILIDVIEVQMSLMDQQIRKCQEFDTFKAAHAKFLSMVAAQTFLHVPAMQACFKDLFELALSFYRLLQGENREDIAINIEDINNEFKQQMQLFFSLLQGMYQQSSGQSFAPIAQLLLRLDFNFHLTEGMGQIV